MHPNAMVFGRIVGGDTSAALRIYNLPTDPGFADALAARLGWTYGKFSFPNNPPDFSRSYSAWHVWIYDPAEAHGAFRFPDWTTADAIAYTTAWRVSHEIAHGLAAGTMDHLFGPGRRKGRLGDPLTPREAARALTWEDCAFRLQRDILEDCGVKISDVEFGREWRINMADAVHRVLTGDFSDPGPEGFLPNDGPLHDTEFALALDAAGAEVREAYRAATTRRVER